LINAFSVLLNLFINLYDRLTGRIKIVDVRLLGPRVRERNDRRVWLFELAFTVRTPKGMTVTGKYVLIPRVKREGKWIDYAPLVSPIMNFTSRSTFAPLYIETDFKNYIHVEGQCGESSTSAVAAIDEFLEVLLEIASEDRRYRGTIKKVKIQKLLKKVKKFQSL